MRVLLIVAVFAVVFIGIPVLVGFHLRRTTTTVWVNARHIGDTADERWYDRDLYDQEDDW